MSARKWDDHLPHSWDEAARSPPRDERDSLVLEPLGDRFVLRPRSTPADVRASDLALVSDLIVDAEP